MNSFWWDNGETMVQICDGICLNDVGDGVKINNMLLKIIKMFMSYLISSMQMNTDWPTIGIVSGLSSRE